MDKEMVRRFIESWPDDDEMDMGEILARIGDPHHSSEYTHLREHLLALEAEGFIRSSITNGRKFIRRVGG